MDERATFQFVVARGVGAGLSVLGKEVVVVTTSEDGGELLAHDQCDRARWSLSTIESILSGSIAAIFWPSCS